MCKKETIIYLDVRGLNQHSMNRAGLFLQDIGKKQLYDDVIINLVFFSLAFEFLSHSERLTAAFDRV